MIHPLDRVAGAALGRGPQRLKFFSGGWGDESRIGQADALAAEPTTIDISWITHAKNAAGHTVAHGCFTSPAANLPARSRIASVISVSPENESGNIVVLMPAWNEHDPKVRVAMANLLAAKGIRSIILENPYYGSRHPYPAGGQPIQTVADFMVMGGAAVHEARAILTAFHRSGAVVGVAGYSMGGNTAALVSATLDFPTATAPLAASHSPGPVFLDGVLSRGIDWTALGGWSQEPRLRSALSSISVLNIEPKPHLARAIIVRAANDGYIPKVATDRLVDHWHGSELRVLPGGHATLVWFRKPALARAIADSFDRLATS